eukprot:gene317-20979_t
MEADADSAGAEVGAAEPASPCSSDSGSLSWPDDLDQLNEQLFDDDSWLDSGKESCAYRERFHHEAPPTLYPLWKDGILHLHSAREAKIPQRLTVLTWNTER